jgi:hypothetical protein
MRINFIVRGRKFVNNVHFETVITPPQISDSGSNKASPRTFQTGLVHLIKSTVNALTRLVIWDEPISSKWMRVNRVMQWSYLNRSYSKLCTCMSEYFNDQDELLWVITTWRFIEQDNSSFFGPIYPSLPYYGWSIRSENTNLFMSSHSWYYFAWYDKSTFLIQSALWRCLQIAKYAMC